MRARERCNAVVQAAHAEQGTVVVPSHKIEIQLPSHEWANACERVGRIDGNAVGTSQLLAALILESESWRQHGDDASKYDAGWNEDSLVSSLNSLTATTAGLSLARTEKRLAWVVAVAAAVSAASTVAIAIATWCKP